MSLGLKYDFPRRSICSLQHQGAAALFHGLDCHKLLELNLGQNKIGPTGLRVLLPAVNHSLRSLVLSPGNELGREGLEVLVDVSLKLMCLP